MIENKNITEVFNALNSQIALHKGCPLSLVVCGGTALCALGLILRTTKDVDVLGELLNENNVLTIKPLDSFPDWLIQAATIVQRDFNLSTNWLNTGPKSQLELGLPHGFVERLIKKSYGKFLTIYYISRFDQIHFKLFAALDRGGYHTDDLIKLKPSHNEMKLASEWVLTQDVSEEFKNILKDFLIQKGFNEIAERF